MKTARNDTFLIYSQNRKEKTSKFVDKAIVCFNGAR